MVDNKSMETVRAAATIFGKLLFSLLLIVTFAAVALELGAWKVEEVHTGPFGPDPFVGAALGRNSVGFPVTGDSRVKCCLLAKSDVNENTFQSDLKLWINGQPMGPAHFSAHDGIRDGGTSAYSHWNGYLIFALPAGVPNTAETYATIQYRLTPLPGVTLLLLLANVLVGSLWYYWTIRDDARARRRVFRAPYLLLRTAGYVALAATLIYAASTLYAYCSGWAFPSTALMHWSPLAKWAAENDVWLGQAVLLFAGFGTVASWAAFAFPGGSSIVAEANESLMVFWRRWGLLIVAGVFVFSISAIWAGIFRRGDLQDTSILGLVPFSDAAGYFADAHDQVRDDAWNEISLRRPLGAAFRSALMLTTGFSYSSMLMLQTLMLAAVTAYASWMVMRWRGVWAGLAFFALAYIFVRGFIPVALSEPLGLFWGLFSVPFFIAALWTGSRAHALLGIAAIALALMIRMGSLFTIPALACWLIWQFGTGLGARIRIALVAIVILIGVFVANTGLQKAYGTGEDLTGSNLSYLLCGLSIGTGWDGCIHKIANEGGQLPANEVAKTKALYAMAWAAFREHPETFFVTAFNGARGFMETLGGTLWRGYYYVDDPGLALRNTLFAIAIAGLLVSLYRWSSQRELSFWVLLWASVLLSAAIVYSADGRRALSSIYPLLWLTVAIGFGLPASARPPEPADSRGLFRSGVIVFTILCVWILASPWLAHRLLADREHVDLAAPTQNEFVLAGGRRMTGFVVTADAEPYRKGVATVMLSTFTEIIRNSGIEIYQGLVTPIAPPTPFGFVISASLRHDGGSNYSFIVPPDVVERQDVRAWRFVVRDWQRKPNYGPYWFYVTRAEPLQ
jgi:hypothetical protein